ncbi:MAG: DNA-binding protein, partial [Actinotalea sp.]|nr:DNA-binding protein [Actinotalea sp.]
MPAYADRVTDLDALVGEWLPLPDVAERLGRDVGTVRRLVEDGSLLALRRGERGVRSVPAGFLVASQDGGWQIVPALPGTLTLLADAGFSDEAAVRWLFTP